MPENGLDRIAGHDAIFLGAIGSPTVLGRRVALDAADADPARLSTIRQPAAGSAVRRACRRRSPIPGRIDMMIVRENNEGEYSEVGGRMFPGTDQEMVVQEAIFTRRGCDRVMRFAFELARRRKRKVTSRDEVERHHSHHAVLGRAVSRRQRRAIPTSPTEQYHIDILTAHFVAVRRASTSSWRAICSATSSRISGRP